MPVDPAYPFPDAAEIVLDPEVDFDFSVHHNYYPPVTPEPSSSSEDEDMSDAFTASSDAVASPSSPTISKFCDFDVKDTSKQVRFLVGDSPKHRDMGRAVSSWKSNKSKRHHGLNTSHSKRREKMYRCPVSLFFIPSVLQSYSHYFLVYRQKDVSRHANFDIFRLLAHV